MRIGVFGGSFDPIHHGHLIVAELLRERLGLDELWLIPAGEQPFKVGQHRAPAADRAAMVELAVAASSGLRADRVEVDRPGPSYTVDTLRTLRKRCPTDHFSLLVGSDAARDLPKWREADALRGLAEVIVFRRGSEAGEPGTVEVPRIEISSTAVRERVKAGKSVRYWVPAPVEAYIAEHGLYRNG
ncbi:MAG: nicotinate-nucleotide adenylyltransferase [Gemmatimonadota bacterium]